MYGVPRSENPWPLSGTIIHHALITFTRPDGERTRERTATITFNGTQFVIVNVNGEDFEIDLADRTGRRPPRR